MITVLIKNGGPGAEETVRGVVYLDTPEGCVTDPARMDVAARRADPEKITELLEERLPLLACVRNLKRLFDLPAREIRRALGTPKGCVTGEHLRLETEPIGRGSP